MSQSRKISPSESRPASISGCSGSMARPIRVATTAWTSALMAWSDGAGTAAALACKIKWMSQSKSDSVSTTPSVAGSNRWPAAL